MQRMPRQMHAHMLGFMVPCLLQSLPTFQDGKLCPDKQPEWSLVPRSLIWLWCVPQQRLGDSCMAAIIPHLRPASWGHSPAFHALGGGWAERQECYLPMVPAGMLSVINATHARWEYFRNADPQGKPADSVLLAKNPACSGGGSAGRGG